MEITREQQDMVDGWCKYPFPEDPYKGEWCTKPRGHSGKHWTAVSVLWWDEQGDFSAPWPPKEKSVA